MFTPATQVKPHVKVLCIGPSGSGKTHGGLELPGPIAGFDMEDGLYPFVHQFSFDLARGIQTIDELNDKIRQLLKDRNLLNKYETFHMDGVTKLWHEALRDAENDRGQIKFSQQREIKSGGKELTDLIMDLGGKDRNVWVTVQAKADWEVGPDNQPRLKGMKGDMDQRLFYAFDLVIYVDKIEDNGHEVRIAKIIKSRFPQFKMGSTIKDFSVAKHFPPLFSPSTISAAPARPAAGGPNATQVTRLRELAQELGSEAKGGKIPLETAQQVASLMKGEGTEAEATTMIATLETLKATTVNTPATI